MRYSDGGKGSDRRPEDKKRFDEGYDRIFLTRPEAKCKHGYPWEECCGKDETEE
jgi:hypothetical protein